MFYSAAVGESFDARKRHLDHYFIYSAGTSEEDEEKDDGEEGNGGEGGHDERSGVDGGREGDEGGGRECRGDRDSDRPAATLRSIYGIQKKCCLG